MKYQRCEGVKMVIEQKSRGLVPSELDDTLVPENDTEKAAKNFKSVKLVLLLKYLDIAIMLPRLPSRLYLPLLVAVKLCI